MTRGGYITILMFLLVMFGYQSYQNDKMFDRYEKAIQMKYSAEYQDSTELEMQNITDSIKSITQALKESSDKSDTVIQKSYIRNIYITPEKSEVSNTDDKIELITKTD